MMREGMGLYRGRRLDNGKWVEGYLYEHEPPLQGVVPDGYTPPQSSWFIVKTGFADWNMPRPMEYTEVYPDTIEACSGKRDINGRWIFECDLVKGYNIIKSKVVYCIVVWHETGFYLKNELGYMWDMSDLQNIEIVGEAHG